MEIVGQCGDGESAVRAIREQSPDLVVLDVQMPGLDGFGVIERVGSREMPPVVFVTAYDEHAIRAFDVHALDYVLKPFEDARLITAREEDDRIRFVLVESIAYLEADGNYVVVHSSGEHRLRTTLIALLEQLDPRRFVRIHRSTAVNLDHIRELQPWFGGDYVANPQ